MTSLSPGRPRQTSSRYEPIAAKRENRDIRRRPAGVEFGNVEQCAEQVVHRGQRRFDSANDLTAFACAYAAVQLRDEKPDRMQRLAQIVACRSQETGFGEIGGFQLPGALLTLPSRVACDSWRRAAMLLN